MRKQLNQKGFSVLQALLMLVIIGLISFTGWYVYKSGKDANNSLDKTASNQSVTTGQKSKKSDESKSDVYAGWKSYTLNKEKLSFMYPTEWTLEDVSANDVDQVILREGDPRDSNAFDMQFYVASNSSAKHATGGCDSSPLLVSEQLEFLGHAAYWNAFATCGDAKLTSGFSLSTSANNAPPIAAKNFGPKGIISIAAHRSKNGLAGNLSVEDVKNDTAFQKAKLVIESIKY